MKIDKDKIEKYSIPFPLYLVDKKTKATKIAIYVEDMSEEFTLGLPSAISVIRETENGTETLGFYKLVEIEKYPSEENLKLN